MTSTGQTEAELDVRGISILGSTRFYDLMPKLSISKSRLKKRPRDEQTLSSSSSSSSSVGGYSKTI